MDAEALVTLFTIGGSAIGTFGGILLSNKLTNHRIEQLEKKVEKHNNVIERTSILEEKMKVANHRLGDLEKEK